MSTISTVAGKGQAGYSGDGGPARQATLHEPTGLAVDVSGDLFVADWLNNRVRKVNRAGIMTTVAGSGPTGLGHLGPEGDGGPAVKARLASPWGLAVNAVGELFIADEFHHRIRKVDRRGVIHTVAGTGTEGHSGDEGPAVKARLDRPRSLTLDARGNLYFVEFGYSCVRKINPAGIITTVAGTGIAGRSPDGGAASRAKLQTPLGLAVDAAGDLFISETFGHRVRKVDRQGIITTVAGTGDAGDAGEDGPAIKAQLHTPAGIAVDSAGNLFIAEGGTSRVRRVTRTGMMGPVAGTGEVGYSGDGGPAVNARVSQPVSLAIDARGNLFIGETIEPRIRKITGAAAPGLLAGKPFPSRRTRLKRIGSAG